MEVDIGWLYCRWMQARKRATARNLGDEMTDDDIEAFRAEFPKANFTEAGKEQLRWAFRNLRA